MTAEIRSGVARGPLRLEELGLVGNGQFAAHVGADGDVVWCCLPRFDAEPLLAALLDGERGGRFRVAPVSGVGGRQRYFPNTNVLETEFEDDAGAFRVVDFAPRFIEHQRAFHPTQLFRIMEPLRGTPRVQVECQPILGWSRKPGARGARLEPVRAARASNSLQSPRSVRAARARAELCSNAPARTGR